jgi:hypothetical protein
MSRDYYWRVFLKMKADDEDRKHLMSEKELYDQLEPRGLKVIQKDEY